MTSSSSACCKINRAPRRPTTSTGSCPPWTPDMSLIHLSAKPLARGYLLHAGTSIFDLFRVKAEATPATSVPRLTRRDPLEAGELDPDYEPLISLACRLGVSPALLIIRAQA